jgi:hypothetical protein
MKEKNKQFNFATIFEGFLTAFNINRGLIPTLRDLLINPSIVIKYYIAGKIDKYGYNKYFSPGRFFVTVLAILSIFAFFAADTDISDSMISELSSRGETDDELKVRITEKTTAIMMFFFNNPMFGFLLLIIPSALSTRLVFKSHNYNLAKHFVVNIYCFCFIALVLGVFSLFFNQEEYLMYAFQQMDDARNNIKTDVLWKFEFYSYMFYLIPILYYFYSFKDVFNLSWLSSIFKTLVSLVLSSAIIFLSLIVGLLTFFLS